MCALVCRGCSSLEEHLGARMHATYAPCPIVPPPHPGQHTHSLAPSLLWPSRTPPRPRSGGCAASRAPRQRAPARRSSALRPRLCACRGATHPHSTSDPPGPRHLCSQRPVQRALNLLLLPFRTAPCEEACSRVRSALLLAAQQAAAPYPAAPPRPATTAGLHSAARPANQKAVGAGVGFRGRSLEGMEGEEGELWRGLKTTRGRARCTCCDVQKGGLPRAGVNS